jgi:hypothetical protein
MGARRDAVDVKVMSVTVANECLHHAPYHARDGVRVELRILGPEHDQRLDFVRGVAPRRQQREVAVLAARPRHPRRGSTRKQEHRLQEAKTKSSQATSLVYVRTGLTTGRVIQSGHTTLAASVRAPAPTACGSTSRRAGAAGGVMGRDAAMIQVGTLAEEKTKTQNPSEILWGRTLSVFLLHPLATRTTHRDDE